MPEQIVFRLPAAADGTYEYALLDGGGDVAGHGFAGSGELPRLLAGRRCLVVVPGADVLVTTVRMPTRRRTRITQALPFALEERLTSEVEDLHFAVGRVERDGTVHAAVVERAVMERWREEWEAAGVEPHAVIPENGAVPVDADRWRIVADEERAVLSLGDGAFALESEAAAVAVEAALAAASTPPESVVIEAPEAVSTQLQAVLAVGNPGAVEARAASGPLLARLAAAVRGRPAIDLLQGEYARRERWGWVWRPLRPAAALLAVWVAAQFSLQVAEMYRLEGESERLRAEIEQVYRDTFPEGRVVNPMVQMRQHLNAARGGTEADGGGPRLTGVLAGAAPALAGDELHLRSLRLRDGALEVELETRDIESLERVRAAIEESGALEVDVRSASARDGRVEGRLIIREVVA